MTASQIFIVSGGTGHTAEQLIRASLAQFSDADVALTRHTRIRRKQQVLEIVQQAAEAGALIFHSLVVPSLRQAMDEAVRRADVPAVDVLGPSLALLGDYLHTKPQGRAGLLYQVHQEQLDRMDAMDFTLAHDDGHRVWELKDADVVLIGASRTSKSVTCFYLAYRGIRAANVPLIPGQSVPVELMRLSPKRVIGLTMTPAHLEAIRRNRLEHLSDRPLPQYAELRDIRAELRQIQDVMVQHHWRSIDVSYKATEEVAERILSMLPANRRPRKKGEGGHFRGRSDDCETWQRERR